MGRAQAARSSAAGPWALVLVARRWQSQWRLQLALLLVAVASAGALSALVPLVQATEPAVVRAAITALPPDVTAIDAEVVRPSDDPGTLRDEIGRGLAQVLGSGTPPPGTAAALSQALRTTTAAGRTTVSLAAVDDPGRVASLTSGAWPAAGSADVAVPEAAARELGLRIGDALPVAIDTARIRTVRISGTYLPLLDAALWRVDPLAGAGEDPAFVDPDSSFALPGEAIGPLIGPGDALDDGALPLQVVDLRYAPDLRATPPGALRATAARIAAADVAAAAAVGRSADSVELTGSAPTALRRIEGGLATTRALVATAGGVLIALTVAVLLVIARLLAAARAGEQRVLVERGAGRRHVVGLAAIEALGTGAVVALLAPLPALLLYGLLVSTPGARAAGVPQRIGVSAGMWAVAAGFGLVLAVVLLVAALRPTGSDRSGRRSRVSAAARSGVDVAVLLVALVLLQRLLAAAGPPSGAALAAPVVLLVAAALIGLRLVALTGLLLEPIARRTRSAAGALAAFELGRRSQRSAAAVLVVALGLGSAALGLAQLRTWQASQREQAETAAGVPVRAAATGRAAVPSARARAADPRAALVVRQTALVGAGRSVPDGTTVAAEVLALPARARALLSSSGADDGTAARRTLTTPRTAAGAEPDVPADATRLRIDLAAASAATPRQAGTLVSALLRTRDGLIVSTVAAQPGTGATGAVVALPGARPLRFVGLAFTAPGEATGSSAVLHVTGVVALGGPAPAVLPPPSTWSVAATGGDVRLDGHGFGGLVVSTGQNAGRPVTARLLAWPSAASVPVLLEQRAARTLRARTGSTPQLLVGDAQLPATVVGVVAHAPASAPVADLLGGAGPRPAVLVDRERLQRALVAAGRLLTDGDAEQEWWLDPPAGQAAALRSFGPGAAAVSIDALTTRLQDGPLRVAVVPALLLLVGSGGLLTLVAFAAQAAASRRDRRFDVAQLRAAGATSGELARVDALVAAVLIVIGALVGLPSGLLIASWSGPRLVTGEDGGPAVPPARFDPSLGAVAVLVLAAAAVLLLVVVVVSLVADRRGTAGLIRIGGEP